MRQSYRFKTGDFSKVFQEIINPGLSFHRTVGPICQDLWSLDPLHLHWTIKASPLQHSSQNPTHQFTLMWVGTCIPAAWPRLQNTPIPGNFKKLLLHVFGKLLMSLANSFSSFSSFSHLDVLGLSQNDEFSSFCFKIKLGFFVSRQLETYFSFPAPLCFWQMALLQILMCVY